MKCQSPFFAGDPTRPNTMLLAAGCRLDATMRVIRLNVEGEYREGIDHAEAFACGTHARAVLGQGRELTRPLRGEQAPALAVRLESLSSVPEPEPPQTSMRRAA